MTDNILKDFLETNDITIQQILNNLINSDKNIALKTEIYNPKKLATLLTYAEYLKSRKFVKSYKVIFNFIETYLKYMVSNKRKSRMEVIKALTNLTERKETESSINVSQI